MHMPFTALRCDYPVTPFAARYGLWAAQTMFLEDRIGSIEVGKDADLAVWDRNPYEVPTTALKDLRCDLTLVRGKVVPRE